MEKLLFTSESVTEGHPDKMCDAISDAILDACMEQDPMSRVACEAASCTGFVLVTGEITTKATLDIPAIVRKTVNEIGYNDAKTGFDGHTCAVMVALDQQSADIAMGVDKALEAKEGELTDDLDTGAGDQGMMFGYATNETPEFMPYPISLAHKLALQLTKVRKDGTLTYLRPDGKTQVSVEYDEAGKPKRLEAVVLSTQHDEDVTQEQIHEDIKKYVFDPILPKELIDGDTKGERVFIPVVVSVSGMTDLVYNDFYVADGADVTIVAGCGIHNSGCNESRHDGIHTFHVGENANVKYEEKHYGEGNGTGSRVLNPVTNIEVGRNSVFTMDTAQIKGVDSTVRETNVELAEGAKLYVLEKLMTDGEQKAESNIEVCLEGSGSSAQIVSRSVCKGHSLQTFHPKAVGRNKCHAHIQCDSIIMDQAHVGSIPEIQAEHVDAAIIHEAAIGRINDEQLLKLRTLGMTEAEAENVIIENFLS